MRLPTNVRLVQKWLTVTFRPTHCNMGLDHRYLKKSRLLKFCHVPATSAAFSKDIFAAATNSTNQTIHL